jgi:hypothetical protein
MTFDEFSERMFELRARYKARGDRMFLGIPDDWYEKPGPKYRCQNGHVITGVHKSEVHGDLCYKCGFDNLVSVYMTYPEDVDGPFDIDLILPKN